MKTDNSLALVGRLPAVLIAGIALLFNACSEKPSSPESAPAETTPAARPLPEREVSPPPVPQTPPVPSVTAAPVDALKPFMGVDLKAVRLVLDGQAITLPPEPALTLQFTEAGKIGGFSGINRYTGSFTLADGGKLTIGPGLASTKMAGPPQLMELEDQFTKALTSATRLSPSPDGVILQTDDAKNLIEFRR